MSRSLHDLIDAIAKSRCDYYRETIWDSILLIATSELLIMAAKMFIIENVKQVHDKIAFSVPIFNQVYDLIAIRKPDTQNSEQDTITILLL
mgnify:CR=1 FL=1